jgi:conjugal transfer pilus assembly protein TraF
MKLFKTVLLISLTMPLTLFASSNDEKRPKQNGFYSKEAKGWFFYEDPKKEEELLDKKTETTPQNINQANPNEKPEEIKIDVEWLRENLQPIMDAAQNNPTNENLAKYAYVQRLMVDMSTRFAMKMSTYMNQDPLLDENNRRPTSLVNLNEFKSEIIKYKQDAISKINEKAHIWFFYKSTCPYCQKQIPILRMYQERYGAEILAISMDGIQLPGLELFKNVIDHDMSVSNQMNIERTPTLLLMTNDGQSHAKITVGLETLPKLESKMLEIAKVTKIITEEEFNKTQEVYDDNSLKQVDGVLIADKEKMENDPQYFIELMQKQLELNNNRFNSSER